MTDDFVPYSKRNRQRERAGQPVIYEYDDIPDEFRAQAYYAIRSAIGPFEVRAEHRGSGRSNYTWTQIEEHVRDELGILELSPYKFTPEEKWVEHVTTEPDPELVLDAIEIAVLECLAVAATSGYGGPDRLAKVEAAIQKLNRRFREHDLGYELAYGAGKAAIVRIDSQYVHAEVVEPAIAALHAAAFTGPLDEFMRAHRDYRKGHNKAAATEAAKAFESTMKAICDARGWLYKAGANASDLIKVLIDNGLIPKPLESYFLGLPTLRNKLSAHGQGSAVVEMHDHHAAFALHLSAASIVFLMAAQQAQPTGNS